MEPKALVLVICLFGHISRWFEKKDFDRLTETHSTVQQQRLFTTIVPLNSPTPNPHTKSLPHLLTRPFCCPSVCPFTLFSLKLWLHETKPVITANYHYFIWFSILNVQTLEQSHRQADLWLCPFVYLLFCLIRLCDNKSIINCLSYEVAEVNPYSSHAYPYVSLPIKTLPFLMHDALDADQLKPAAQLFSKVTPIRFSQHCSDSPRTRNLSFFKFIVGSV